MVELRSQRSLILCHHGVGDSPSTDDPYFLRVPAQRFRAQLELMLEGGFEFLTVAELVELAHGGAPPPGYAAVSFDDGMEDNYSIALPILREYGVPATIYVTTGFVGEPNPFMAATSGLRMMTADELRELADEGVELGAHTVSHPDMERLDRVSCLKEMLDSREAIEELTGARVRTFAYPFCRYNDEARAAAAEARFEAAVTCDGRGSWDPLELQRVLITGKDGLASFLLKLAGIYHPLFESAPGRFLRASTRGVRRRARTARAA